MKSQNAVVVFLSLFVIVALLWAEPVPFDPSRGIVEVPVTINGNVVGKFGVDTGADRLYVDKTFAESNGLPIRKHADRVVVGIDGQSEAGAVDLRSFEFAGNSLHNISATVIDMQAMTSDKQYGYPDGLIGYELLQRCYVTVDYKNKSLDLQMEEPGFLSEESLVRIPFDIRYHFILVDVVLNNSVKARCILDYCAIATILTPEIAKELDLTPDNRQLVTLSRLSVGDDLVSENVPAFVNQLTSIKERTDVQIDGILGANFLFRHKITVDYKRNRLYVHF